MKKILILIALLVFASEIQAQKLLKYTHKYTGDKWEETTWEPFMRKGAKGKGFEVDERFRKVGNDFYFEIVIKNQVKTHFIDEGDVLVFTNYLDSPIVTLVCSDAIDTRDPKDVGIYPISVEQMQLLLNNKVKDILLEYRKGYKKDGLTERKLMELRNCITLITMDKMFNDEKPRIYNKTK